MTHRSRIVCLVAMLMFLCATDARAFRPFDGTDAAVVNKGKIEIELGPSKYLREESARSLTAPATVVNYGFAPDWEGVVQGNIAHGISSEVPGTSLSGVG